MLAVAAVGGGAVTESLYEAEDAFRLPDYPGFVALAPGRFDANPFPRGLDFLSLPADAQRDFFHALLFPPPPEAVVKEIVYASGWSARLGAETSLAAPRDVAAAVLRSITSGQSIRDLAKDLLPIVDNVRATARRVARDETMRVMHTMQRDAELQIDDLVVGRQVFAVDNGHSPTSRPEHKKRHGTIYYKKPGPGQHDISECPNPPYEADGTLAYNCRCWTSAVLVDPDTIAGEPVPAGTLDLEMTADWFDDAPERDQRIAVGVERHTAVKWALGRKPGWRDFIGPAGELLDTDELIGRLAGV
jgi:hypothetical protein